MMIHHERRLQVTLMRPWPLDESQEGHGETKLDAEEAIEVDHSHDLDMF